MRDISAALTWIPLTLHPGYKANNSNPAFNESAISSFC